jgi:hypothetical protein
LRQSLNLACLTGHTQGPLVLAGAMTLLDHTRVFVEEFYIGTEVNKEFKNRIQREFSNNELTSFVQDLRNYMMHRGMPPITHTLVMKPANSHRLGEVNATTFFNLSVEKLRKWKNWRRSSKNFFENYDDSIHILTLVEEYSSIIYKFHSELNALMLNYHKKDLEELSFLQNALREQEELYKSIL